MSLAKSAASLALGALIALAPISAAWATSRQAAEATINEAKEVREQAMTAGVVETDSAEMIAEAEALVASRQYTRAVMVAKWAIRQDQFAMQISKGEVPVDEDKGKMAQALIEAAEAARVRAAEVGGEWRDVDAMLKEAQTLVKAGEFDRAIEAAAFAKFQGERGYEQAMAEKDAGFPEYMSKAAGQ